MGCIKLQILDEQYKSTELKVSYSKKKLTSTFKIKKRVITDHLGSTRVIVDNAGNIKEQNDYYPFGMRHENSLLMVSSNRWGYNNKEKQTIFAGFNLLDYGNRMYDPELGRWFVQDMLQEKYYSFSNYNFCFNNPLKFVDFDGKEPQRIPDEVKNQMSKEDQSFYDKIDRATSAAREISNAAKNVVSLVVSTSGSVYNAGTSLQVGNSGLKAEVSFLEGSLKQSSSEGAVVSGTVASAKAGLSIDGIVSVNTDISLGTVKISANNEQIKTESSLGEASASANIGNNPKTGIDNSATMSVSGKFLGIETKASVNLNAAGKAVVEAVKYIGETVVKSKMNINYNKEKE